MSNKETAMMQLLKYILVDCRNENGNIQFHANETFNRFLEMEKQQIECSFADGFVEGVETQKSGEQLLFPKQYYNETFKNK